jgi:hypothetical protein
MKRTEIINEMSQYLVDDKAEVGIFWYDEDVHELIQVHSIPVCELKEGQLTYPKLHKTIWQKLRQKTIQYKNEGKKYDPIYLQDYTQAPRGRIFVKEDTFHVFVGSWITEEIKKMIIEEFNLQKSNVVFRIDQHWEIGHGWSTEQDVLDFNN